MAYSTDVQEPNPAREDIAIIGMACLFPGAPDLTTYWENIVSGVDAITDPPAGAWDTSLHYDPASNANDRIYCKRGGFLGPLAAFDPLEHGIMPSALYGSEPDQWLALQVARAALMDAGYGDHVPERERTAVILGKGTYLNHGNFNMLQHGQVVDQTIGIIRKLHPEYSEVDVQLLKDELRHQLSPFNADTVAGLVPNVTVGRIANRLDLMGPSYTVDAACASSLVAVDIAQRDLASGRCDLALVGGVHVVTPATILMLFCQLGALSRQQQIRPFDVDADGTILSEGLGMVVLKRRTDAERDGNRIYATIKGVGIASDGRALSVLAPRVEGEELALRRAYEQAGISPGTIGLIEAHGTATLVGDATEVEALARVMGASGGTQRCALGTVKSMIGHTMPAAGMAGLIKTALALYHKILPPTLHVNQPSPRLGLERTSLYLNTETRPWIHGARHNPRRAGVNSFGFGGINAHVVLEEHSTAEEPAAPHHLRHWETEVLIVAGTSRDDLLQQGQQLAAFLQTHPDVVLKDLAYTLNTRPRAEEDVRLAIIATTPADLSGKLDRALSRLADPACRKIKDVQGIYFSDEPLGRSGRVAFLFPGEGAQYVNMLADLCLHFPEVRTCFDAIDRVFEDHPRGYTTSHAIFPPPVFSDAERAEAGHRLWHMDSAIESLFAANQALFTLLSQLDISPQALLGHSTGEFSAMRAAGMLDMRDFEQRVLELNHLYERVVTAKGIPDAVLLVVGADRERVNRFANTLDATCYVAMDNCPHQVVLAVDKGDADNVLAQARQQGLICEVLPFDRAYHTPLYAPYAETTRDILERWMAHAPQLVLYSCTTAGRYPSDLAAIRQIAHDHWIQPVEFRRTIETMYDDGFRVFVEVGPKGNLTAFVDDILRGRPGLAVPTNLAHRSGITQLNHVAGLLAAHAVPMRLDRLYARRVPLRLDVNEAGERGHTPTRTTTATPLATGWPAMSISDTVAEQLRQHNRPAQTASVPEVQPDQRGNGNGMAPHGAQAAKTTVASLSGHTRNGLNGNGTNTHSSSNGTGVPIPAVPASTTPIATPTTASAALMAYMQTMNQFLAVQQEVMQSYLGRTHVTSIPVTIPQVATVEQHVEQHVAAVAEPSPTPTLPIPDEPAAPSERLADTLVRIVGEKTGYPIEMLDLTLDLETDLGIDSIKRVEIIGAVQQATGMALGSNIEKVSARRTLQAMIDTLEELRDGAAPPGVQGVSTEELRDGQAAPQTHGASTRPFRFIDEIIELIPNHVCVAQCTITLETCSLLRDHTLGRDVSVTDPELTGLPVVPMTMSMELLAEVGAVLMPSQVLIGMKDVRLSRWIALDQETVTLELRAEQTHIAGEVHARLHEAAFPGTRTAPIGEATLVFAAVYPPAPQMSDVSLQQVQPAKWLPTQLYQEAMFHGPRFRGVQSLESIGQNGAKAQITTIPFDNPPTPANAPLLTDLVLLDQPGQVVGFWAAQLLEHGYLVFPFHLSALHLYGPTLPPDEALTCLADIALVGEQQVRSNLDLVHRNGNVWARLTGWHDKRFDLPRAFYRLLFAGDQAPLSQPCPMITGGPAHAYWLGLNAFPDDFFSAQGGIWQRVLAHLILSRRERSLWRNMHTPERRQIEWLLGRFVAKEAVRDYLKHDHGIALKLADIEILPNEYGCPIVTGAWLRQAADAPVVSIAHAAGMAVALVAPATVTGVGIDIEHVGRVTEDVGRLAFTDGERELLAGLDTQENWAERLWCAKEAVAKALGHGLIGGPQSLVLQAVDAEHGVMQVGVAGELARRLPHIGDTLVAAATTRMDEFIVAASLYGRNTNNETKP